MISLESLNKVQNTYLDNTSSVMDFPDLPYFDGVQYDIYDEKDYSRMINDIERVVRTSYEYRHLISYLKAYCGMNECAFLQNVSSEDSSKVKIEIHHSPLTLYDITATVVKKRLHCKQSIDIFDCAQEIMWLHYIGYVGLYPVSETVHELIHNGYIFVPMTVVHGNWREFVNSYYDYIPPDTLDSINASETLTAEWLAGNGNTFIDTQMRIFSIHQTYLRFNDRRIQSQIPNAKGIIKERVAEIKNMPKQMYYLLKPDPLKEDKPYGS